MTNIKSRLTHVESRLQTLVEGGATRIIPFLQFEDELRSRLVESLQAGIRIEADGTQVAPNLYKLVVQPDQVSILVENQVLLDRLLETVQQKGKELGAHFCIPPAIKVSGDPKIITHQVKIISLISRLSIEKTNAIVAGSDHGGKSNRNPRDTSETIPCEAFLIVDGKINFPLKHNVLNIGRRIDNHLVIDDQRVSRLHAQLRSIKGNFVIFDLDSAGGTFVNNERIQQYVLHPGDVISLAGVTLVFGQEFIKSTDRTQEIHLKMDDTL